MNTLTQKEFDELFTLEGIISRGQKAFVQVGLALAEIKEKRLYREQYGTFEDYCQKRWNFSSRYAAMIMSGTEAACQLEAESGTIVPNLGQARELSNVPAEKRVEVMAEASKDGKPTAKKIKQAAKKVAPMVSPVPEVPHIMTSEQVLADDEGNPDDELIQCQSNLEVFEDSFHQLTKQSNRDIIIAAVKLFIERT